MSSRSVHSANSGSNPGNGNGASHIPSLSEAEIAMDRRAIMRKIRVHQRNRGQVGEEYGTDFVPYPHPCTNGSGSNSNMSNGGGNGGSGRMNWDEKKASSASNLRGVGVQPGMPEEEEGMMMEDATEGFESMEHALNYSSGRSVGGSVHSAGSGSHRSMHSHNSSGSSRVSRPPPVPPPQSSSSSSGQSWPNSQQRLHQPSVRFDASSFKTDGQQSVTSTANTSTTKTPYKQPYSYRKRQLIHVLYLMICAALVFSFAFLIEAQKLMNYAASPFFKSGTSSLASAVENGFGADGGEMYDSSSSSSSSALSQSMPSPPQLTIEEKRMEDIKSIISPHISTPESLQLLHTPQYRALYWLAVEDGRRLTIPTSSTQKSKLIQRYILALLYFALDGKRWVHDFKFMTALDECRWNMQVEDENGEVYTGGVGGCDNYGLIQTIALCKFSCVCGFFS
uniref:Uncharacterized protein n=1 Tax=Ditylum brightwellii TaxID=49249 RepID=A0A7S4QR66_9STRA